MFPFQKKNICQHTSNLSWKITFCREVCISFILNLICPEIDTINVKGDKDVNSMKVLLFILRFPPLLLSGQADKSFAQRKENECW